METPGKESEVESQKSKIAEQGFKLESRGPGFRLSIFDFQLARSAAHAQRQILPLGFLLAPGASPAQPLEGPQASQIFRIHLDRDTHPAAEALHHRNV
jgi:hypothetical protein